MDEPPHKGPAASRKGDLVFTFLSVTLDAAAIEAAFLLAYWLRFQTPLFERLGYLDEAAPPLTSYVVTSLFVILVWLLLFQGQRMYGARRTVVLSDEFLSIVRVITLGMLMVLSAAFFYRGFSYSRIVFVLVWAFSVLLVFIARGTMLAFERRQYMSGRLLRGAVILGNNKYASEIFERLNGHPSFGLNIQGYFAPAPADAGLALSGAPYLGALSTAPEILRARHIDLAFIALNAGQHDALFEFLGECEGMNIDFLMVPDVVEVLTSQVRITEFQGIPLLRIKSVPFTIWGRVMKRAFDLALSGLLLVVLAPLFLLIAILIRLDSRGPVFFRQERIGLDGTRFLMYKFRSMKAGSERYDSSANLGIKDDPRRTHIGVILRKLSLDELPQLLNVLRGEMSLVGPRPERTQYVREFQKIVPKYIDRHRVKTGITGWAQVNGLRGDTSIEERVRFDLYYIEHWSLAFDIKILLRTLRAALDFRNVH